MMLATLGLSLLLSQGKVAKLPQKTVDIIVGRNVATAPKIRVYVNTKNVRKVSLQIFKLPFEELRNSLNENPKKPKVWTKPVRSFVLDVAKNRKSLPLPQDTYFEQQFNIPNLPPGYYLIQSPEFAGKSWATFNVTNLSLVVKRGEKRVLTWVTEARSGKVVSGATVSVYRGSKRIASSKSDSQGISSINVTPGQDCVLVETPKDAAAVNVTGTSRDGEVVSHMQFDRPVYRPGQSGAFKSILRTVKGLGYAPMSKLPVTMELLDSQSTLLQREELTASEMGTVAGNFDIPKEGALGSYTLRLRKGNRTFSLESFEVEEYRKPEFKLSSAFTQKRYLSGDKIGITLDAEYYFGAKLPDAQVQISVRRSPRIWERESFDAMDDNLHPRDTFYANQVVTEDVRTAGKDGKMQFEVSATADAPDSDYEFSFVVTDGSRRQITHTTSVPVYAASIRISADPKVSYVPLGRLVPILVSMQDLDGKPVTGSVNLEIRRQVWSPKDKRDVEETLEMTTVVVPKSGKVTAVLPAKVQGYLKIVASAKDGEGRKTVSRSGIYVANPFSSPEDTKQPPTVGVRLEKRQFKLGDTVTGFVETNRPGHAILLTMEGSDLHSYQILKKSGPFSYKLGAAASPNMEFKVSQWVEGENLTGGAAIDVLDPSKRLSVSLSPDRAEVSPGDKAKYTVTTKDYRGLPIAAEIALQVVDEAIYAIQPDHTESLISAFWGYRGNRVSTTTSAPEELYGGAYQKLPGASRIMALDGEAPMRTQFVDTAYWNAFIQTDKSGESTVEFEMPGNLTAWRGLARAVTGATEVGEAKSLTRSSRPLTLRLATPRQMVVGDELKLIGTVTNRNNREEKVKVRVVVGDKVFEESVVAPGPGDTKVTIPIIATKLGEMTIRGELFGEAGVRVDGLEVRVPVNPNGVPFRKVSTGRIGKESLAFSLPNERIEGSENIKVRFYAGSNALVSNLEQSLLARSRFTPIIAADQVETAARLNLPWMDDRIREPIAMLGRTRQATGWGWWDEGTPNPVITARVLRALVSAEQYKDWGFMRMAARSAAEYQYRSVQFAEYRAHLVEALALDGAPKASDWALEVNETKIQLSPTAQLALAHALILTGKTELAHERIETLAKLVSRGTTNFLPVGQGVGWSGSELEANARLLELLLMDSPKNPLIDGLADWIINQGSEYMGPGDAGAVIRALRKYSSVRPSPTKLGNIKLTADGANLAVKRQPDGEWVEAILPAALAEKPIKVEGSDLPLRYVVEVNAYRSANLETDSGVRTLFRWEVMNAAGSWQVLDRPIRSNEPIRVAAVVWSDSVTDAVRVVLPIPAGFEYVDKDRIGSARQEVRDGAVTYYAILADGIPATFRYYLRAESDGSILVPAAMAEALRRPESRGNSDSLKVVVSGR